MSDDQSGLNDQMMLVRRRATNSRPRENSPGSDRSYERRRTSARPSQSDARDRESRQGYPDPRRIRFNISDDRDEGAPRSDRWQRSNPSRSPSSSRRYDADDDIFYYPGSRYQKRSRGRRFDYNDYESTSEGDQSDDASSIPQPSRVGTDGSFGTPMFHKRRATNLERNDRKLERQYRMNSILRASVINASRFWDGLDSYGIDLEYVESEQWVDDSQIRWIHCQSERKSLDEFVQFLPQLTDMTSREISLVTSILQDVKQDHQRAHIQYGRLEPLVLRESKDKTDRHGRRSSTWVTFVNMPYLTIEDHRGRRRADPGSFPSQSLLQFQYPLQSIAKSSRQEALKATRKVSVTQSIHVASLWTIWTSTGLLITLSPDNFQSLHHPYIRSHKIDLNHPNPMSRKVRIRDPDGRMFHFPLSYCETYFALVHAVSEACRADYPTQPENYVIRNMDDIEISADEWQDYCSRQEGIFVDIQITLVYYTAPEPPVDTSPSSSPSLSPAAQGTWSDSRSGSREELDRVSPSRSESTSVLPDDHVIVYEVPSSRSSLQSGSGHAEIGAPFRQSGEEITYSVESLQSQSEQRISGFAPDTSQTNTQDQRETFSFDGPQSTARNGDESTDPESQSPSTQAVTAQSNTDGMSTVSDMTHEQALVSFRQGLFERGSTSDDETISINSSGSISDQLVLYKSRPRELPTAATSLALVRASTKAQQSTSLPLNRMRRTSISPSSSRGYSRDSSRRSSYSNLRRRRSLSRERSRPRSRWSRRTKNASSLRRHLSDEKQPPIHGLSTAPRPKNLNVPPFFSWPLRRDLSKDTVSIDDHDNQRIPASNSTVRPEQAASEQYPQLPDHLVKVLADVENRLLDEHEDLSEFSQGQTKSVAEVYKNTQVLAGNSAIQAEHNLWLATHIDDATIFHIFQRYSWQSLLSRICKSWEVISNQFSPEVSGHLLTEKLAACRIAFVTRIREICEPQQSWRAISLHKRARLPIPKYYIFDASTVVDSRFGEPNQPFPYFTGCKKCVSKKSFGRSFSSLSAAKAHLMGSHFNGQEVSEEMLMRYIIPQHRVVDFYACAIAIQLMTAILDNLTEAEKLILEIQRGVTVDGLFQSSMYCLPRRLVDVYQQLVRGTCFALHLATTLSLTQNLQRHRAVRLEELVVQTDLQAVFADGYLTETLLNEVKTDLILMSTGDYSRGMTYESIRPGYLLMILSRDLCHRIVDPGRVDIIEAYTAYVEYLVYQVHHHPRRRLRDSIIRCREELRAIGRIFASQASVLQKLERASDPTQIYGSSYEDELKHEAESEAADSFRRDIRARNQLCRALWERLNTLEGQLIRAIEIEQDDHGKAILVFTMVTVIFLPLSFATSFLGMNTTDIRQTNSGQWVFWAIAIPLTSVTVVVSIVIGYYGEQIRDLLSALHQDTITYLKEMNSNRTSDGSVEVQSQV